MRQTSFGTCKVKLMDIVGIWTLKGRCLGFWTVCQQPGSCCYLLLFPEPTVLVRPNGQPSGLKIKNGRQQTLELPASESKSSRCRGESLSLGKFRNLPETTEPFSANVKVAIQPPTPTWRSRAMLMTTVFGVWCRPRHSQRFAFQPPETH